MKYIKIAILALQHSQKGDLRINQEYDSISKIKNSKILFFKKKSNKIQNFVDTYNQVLRFKPNIIHAHDLHSYILSYFLTKKLKNCKLILDFHEFNDKVKKYYNLIGKLTYYFYKLLEGKLFLRASYIIKAVDKIQEKNILKYKKNNFTVHNFPVIAENKTNKFEQEDVINLAYVGGISPERGIFRNIKLLEKLNNEFKINCKLHLIGDAGNLLEGINTENIICYGRIPHEEVINILTKCDVGLCLLDKRESFNNSQPIKVFEYFSAGLFVICSKLKRPQEMIRNNNVIFFCDDINKIAKKIYELYINNLFLEIKVESHNYVRDNFSWLSEEKKILTIYNDIIKES